MIDELMAHIRRRDVEGVRAMLARGVDVNQRDSKGWSPLVTAAGRGQREIVEALLTAGASPNSTEQYQTNSGLIAAASSGHVEVVRLVIESGADVNYLNKLGRSALMQAAQGADEGHREVVHLLLRGGADVERAGNLSTPLMDASRRGSPAVVRALLAAGAAVNRVTKIGTALIQAIEQNRADNVAVLLAGGADPTVPAPVDYSWNPRYAGKSPLEIATANGQAPISRLLRERLEGTTPTEPLTDPDGVPGSWRRISAHLQSQHAAPVLAPPATSEQLASAEQDLGFALPTDFRASYATCDGQVAGSPGVILPYAPRGNFFQLMPLRSVVRTWTRMRDECLRWPAKRPVDPEILRQPWSVTWLPFAENGAGDYLCVDLSPGASCGQVIAFEHEGEQRFVLAPSLAAYMHRLADALVRGDRFL